MKITLNLSTAPSSRDRYALAWALPAAVLGCAGLVLLSLVGLRSYREYRRVVRLVVEQKQIESRLRDREAALRKQLEQPEFRQIYSQVQFANSLIDKKRLSLPGLAKEVTPLVPARVRLAGLSLSESGKDLLVRFAVVGENEENVETFRGKLEDSPHFRDVAILNQGFEKEGGAEGPVSVVATARYLGGAAAVRPEEEK